ncbi:hypothetical protein SLEP1_g1137 [Rubroshorea leprosula]|uniref:CUE domain-containing protein n=1 Tax=Rubroshorea leprosula TaxID=152421 RepID=A0AAV5HJP0_9ROSI|nr:hypothetical protein SLEP1_g1137 [Rubroshorea leprosula]
MGFNKVYQCLLDLFPQVDKRILKAVAIENSKDVDAAAETILSEILPYLSQNPTTTSPLQKQTPIVQLDDGDSSEEESSQLRVRRSGGNACSSSVSMLEEHENVPNTGIRGSAWNADLVESQISAASNFPTKDGGKSESSVVSMLEIHEKPNTGRMISAMIADSVELQASAVSNFPGKDSGNNESADTDGEELILLGKSPGKNAEVGTSKIIQVRFDAKDVDEDSENSNQSQVSVNLESQGLGSLDKTQAINNTYSTGQSPLYLSVSSSDESVLILGSGGANCCSNDDPQGLDRSVNLDAVICRKSPLASSILGIETVVTQMVSSAQECSLDSPKSDVRVEIGSTNSRNQGDDSVEEDLLSQQDPVNEMGDSGNEPDLDVVDTQFRSSQMCRIDILEEIIEDAKNNKKTLFQVMQSVIDLMRKVEVEEEAAEKANEEAARGDLDILVKVEELKQMLAHANEANDMHAGEVYGEKAILATEVRELQSRLFSLSEERDQSLAILDEMRQTLEARQAIAEEARKEAEQEKLKKKESAQNALAQQEAIMEKMVQKSKILQQEAEENSKLREFLMDRGRIVDSLQGEISVICQDVRLLKQKFDERVPLSKSISSSQTSCILASSGSSAKSVASEPEKISPTPSVDGQSPKDRPEVDKDGADRKELFEDGWDFFEKDAEI